MVNYLYSKIAALDEEAVYAKVNELLAEGKDPTEVLGICRDAMLLAVESYEKRDTYLDSMLDAARIVSKASAICTKDLSADEIPYLGKVITCTVFDDVHQNGRLMAVSVLRACGYDVNDLGGEIPAEQVVAAAAAEPTAVVGLSGLVSSSIDPMKITVEAIRAAGLKNITFVAGGLACEHLRVYAGADYFCKEIPDALHICQKHCK